MIQDFFNFVIGLGGPALMFIVIFILSLVFGVKFSKAFEGGLSMAIALTGMSAIVSLLTSSFSPALNDFVENTGINLSIPDLGWAPLAVITWGSLYTVYFIFVAIVVNLILLVFKRVNTLNVDLFNLWNVSLLGLVTNYYSKNLVVSSLFVAFIYFMILWNADTMKNSVTDLLGYDEDNISTSSHPLLLIAPVVMIFNKLIDLVFPKIDKYDFDAEILDKKIGFFGSKFAIGAYLGVFIGLLGQQQASEIFALAFIGGTCLELFATIGGWFGPAIEPLSNGIETMMGKRFRGRKLYIGLDWAILAARPEVWAVTNILAPILLLIAVILPGNKILPLGGILLTVFTPALLVVTRGKVLRMTIIGTFLIPLFLWIATFMSEFFTKASESMNALPDGIKSGEYFSSIDAVPIEKMLAVLIGTTVSDFQWQYLLYSILAIAVYLLLFKWYVNQMRKQDEKFKLAK
jgi:Phosphotransferase system, galactitol-specific IIC component